MCTICTRYWILNTYDSLVSPVSICALPQQASVSLFEFLPNGDANTVVGTEWAQPIGTASDGSETTFILENVITASGLVSTSGAILLTTVTTTAIGESRVLFNLFYTLFFTSAQKLSLSPPLDGFNPISPPPLLPVQRNSAEVSIAILRPLPVVSASKRKFLTMDPPRRVRSVVT